MTANSISLRPPLWGIRGCPACAMLAGILFAFEGQLWAALGCLMFSGVCDMFDGKVASTKKERTRSEKRFGIQIDSLSDLVCFGVLPAVIASLQVNEAVKIISGVGEPLKDTLFTIDLLTNETMKFRLPVD